MTATAVQRARPAEWANLAVFGWRALAVALLAVAWLVATQYQPAVLDAHAYWAATLGNPYRVSAMGVTDSYHYAPAFLWLLEPIRALPWPIFHGLWEALILAAFAWLVGLDLVPLLLFLPLFTADWAFGNVMILMAAAIVVGFRWPALWAFPILTKASPGIGLLWFVFRRDWRSLATALGATAAIVGVGFLVAPQQWLDWFGILGKSVVDHGGGGDMPGYVGPPLVARCVLAVLVLWWGARSDRAWTVPLAALLASPIWMLSFGLLAGVAALSRPRHGRSSPALRRGLPHRHGPTLPAWLYPSTRLEVGRRLWDRPRLNHL